MKRQVYMYVCVCVWVRVNEGCEFFNHRQVMLLALRSVLAHMRISVCVHRDYKPILFVEC